MDTEALRRSLLGKFVEGTHDRLQAIQLGALELEKGGGPAAGEAVARELHTMKGEARMMGLDAVAQLAHACEELLRALKEGKLEARAAVDTLLHGCDAIADLLEEPQGGGREGTAASAAMVTRLAAVAGAPVPPLKPSPAARGPGEVPAPLVSSDSRVKAAVEVERASPVDRTVRVKLEILDAVGVLAGDLLVESTRAGLRGDAMERLFERFARLGDGLLRAAEASAPSAVMRERLAELETELHLIRDAAFRFVRGHADGLTTLDGNLSQLADHVAQARLVPLASMFEAFPRAVRELAHAQGKRIELIVENTEAGVDRSMVSDLRDALVHLIRNAVDHGVEAPELRARLGKAATGRVTLRALAEGDLLRVEVEDDGRGIDPSRLKEVALRRGIMTLAQLERLSEREVSELIFRPGFTTREEVSELSGRGVGMDVVKRKVEGLGGSVAVHSRIGRSTQVVLRLPQSLALMRVLLVRLGEHVYGMPAADVEAVARCSAEDRLEIMGSVAMLYQDRPVALAALGPLLGLPGEPQRDRSPCVVIRHGEDRAALLVDGFIDEREVAVKPIGGDFLAGAPFIAGSAALEDGRIAVLLHVPDLMAEVRKLTRPLEDPAVSKRLRVLLVDDSPIARATETALVRALGHVVEEAPDGAAAWELLQASSFDIVLTDVQMPRVDGFDLTRRIKGSPELRKVPVVMLTSLVSDEDKRRGLEAGADAYLIKGELGVESLALTIDRLR